MTLPATAIRAFTTATTGGTGIAYGEHEQTRRDLTRRVRSLVGQWTRWPTSAPGPGSALPPPRSRAGYLRHTKDKQS
jgi:hypothetical protein